LQPTELNQRVIQSKVADWQNELEFHEQFQRMKNRAGIAFIDENGGGPGVRLRKRHQKKN
jgi:hypothetical protein